MVVAGLCRLLARKGISVAPFKAQNMSNNSVVTVEGGEIGRAQAMQARAAGLAPSVRFNPILLKPGSDRTSQLVVRGRVEGTVAAGDYFTHRDHLAEVVDDELAGLRSEFDAVICEGAGSPAEINLRATDLANMGLARAANLPVVVVGDIDRGGLLAHLFGTVAVLAPEDQALIAGFVVNKFRGDPALLAPGLTQLEELTGRPTYGVVPFDDGFWLDTEDSVSVQAHRVVGQPQPPRRRAVASGRSDPAAADLQFHRRRGAGLRARRAGALGDRSRRPARRRRRRRSRQQVDRRRPGAGCANAGWPTASPRTLARAGRCWASAAASRCCADASTTPSSRGAGGVDGLGLLDADIVFASEKTLRRHDAPLPRLRDSPRAGVSVRRRRLARASESGNAAVYGTHWHGLLDNDEVRRRWLADAAEAAGRRGFTVAADVDVSARRDAQLDLMADLLAASVDIDAMLALLENGPPGRPTIVTSL